MELIKIENEYSGFVGEVIEFDYEPLQEVRAFSELDPEEQALYPNYE